MKDKKLSLLEFYSGLAMRSLTQYCVKENSDGKFVVDVDELAKASVLCAKILVKNVLEEQSEKEDCTTEEQQKRNEVDVYYESLIGRWGIFLNESEFNLAEQDRPFRVDRLLGYDKESEKRFVARNSFSYEYFLLLTDEQIKALKLKK